MSDEPILPAIEVQLAEPSSPAEFEAYFRFRWTHLRAPWGQPPGSERDESEESASHIWARIASGEPVGVGRIHFPDSDTARIRFMATKDGFRHLGIGTAILHRLEQIARARGARAVTLNARESAVPFYEKRSYSVCRDAPTLFGAIRHKTMEKLL